MWEFWHTKLRTKSRNKSGGDLSSLDGSSDAGLGPKVSGQVNFKDLTLSADDDDDDEEEEEVGDGQSSGGVIRSESVERQLSYSSQYSSAKLRGPRLPERNKLIIIMVGLPGRGKTFLCNKLKCYLNWLGHDTKHVNVGSYRRQQKGQDEVQDAAFFDASNPSGMEARNRALLAALDDLKAYLATDKGQVAILDATNSTEERRLFLVSHFHGHYQYLFIESSCTDARVLEQNYLAKMRYSPDYSALKDTEKALADFKERIRKYEEVYETLTNRNQHYIKLIDMVTGRGYMDVNRISGYIPGKIVFYLMQVCKAGLMQARKIWLTRHGQSEWNVAGRIGGDSSLSAEGEDYAGQLPGIICSRLPEQVGDVGVSVSCWTSTLKRTIQTASGLPFPKLRWKALDEIHAGICDGLTYKQIDEQHPEEFAARTKDKLRYRYPSGESYLDVIQRLEPVVIELERERECVVVVGHQAVLRAILGYFIAVPLEQIPSLEIPLNTVIELRPRPDGTMEVEHIFVPRTPLSPLSPGPHHIISLATSFPTQIQEPPLPPPSQPWGGSYHGPSRLSHKVPFGAIAEPVAGRNDGTRSPIDSSHVGSFGSLITFGDGSSSMDAAAPPAGSHAINVPVEASYNSRRSSTRSLMGPSPPTSAIGSAVGSLDVVSALEAAIAEEQGDDLGQMGGPEGLRVASSGDEPVRPVAGRSLSGLQRSSLDEDRRA